MFKRVKSLCLITCIARLKFVQQIRRSIIHHVCNRLFPLFYIVSVVCAYFIQYIQLILPSMYMIWPNLIKNVHDMLLAYACLYNCTSLFYINMIVLQTILVTCPWTLIKSLICQSLYCVLLLETSHLSWSRVGCTSFPLTPIKNGKCIDIVSDYLLLNSVTSIIK